MSKRQRPDQKQVFNSLSRDLHELVSNKPGLRVALEHFLANVIDKITLGIIFDLHRKYKTQAYEVEEDSEDEENADISIQHNLKKIPECVCPYCESAVAAQKFAPHLANCMGMGRPTRSRNATRKVVTDSKDRDTSFMEITSEDEDDDDLSFGEKRRKKKTKSKGKKTKNTTPKKSITPDISESVNVDIEGDDDDLTILQNMLHLQDNSLNSDGAGGSSHSSTGGPSRRKERSKNKKNSKRDRSSPIVIE